MTLRLSIARGLVATFDSVSFKSFYTSLDNVLHTVSSSLLEMALDLVLTTTPAHRDGQILSVVPPGEMRFSFFLKEILL